MKENINKKFLIALLILISLILISAYIIEYKLGHQPCKLCLYQRIPYILSVLFITKILFFKSHQRITLLILSIVFIIGSLLAFYHFGIEQGFFQESLVCVSNEISDTMSKEKLLEQLKQNSISCKDVSFKILGMSLASINTIFSAILSVIFIKLFINYGKNK
tara:strand:- start:2315 stop:2800 length:486 start_codon:yes stop_codon:yes gene_type:complete